MEKQINITSIEKAHELYIHYSETKDSLTKIILIFLLLLFWIQDLKLGGAHLKKFRRAEGDAKIFGVFRAKIHDFTPKNLIFSNFRGARAGCASPGSGEI
jgi:hypothetical protein